MEIKNEVLNHPFIKQRKITNGKFREYKMLDGSRYTEKVTDLRYDARWDLKNKIFTNHYSMSKDGKSLLLSGTVYSRDGRDSLNWSEKYRRVEVP